jgi:hypothetical protein
MRGVGPSSARFDPLLIDMRNAAGAADHSVLWLRNGGGKTTFERLVFHVLAWNEAKNIGKEEKARPGGIEYLLGPEDVGHVVLEWERADAPDARPLITGLVCQLKQGTGHRRDDDGNLKRSRADVERRFYCFHALPDVDLETITSAQLSDGRRLSLRAYAKTLDSLSDAHPRLRVETTTSVGEWTTMLEDRGLDAELFRYQVHMNQGEGGADQVIARAATNEQFIDFVLRAVTPPADVADVREQFERYREELAQMPVLRRRRAFVAALHETMSQLAAAHAAERAAESAVQAAEAEARALHGRFAAAAERDEARKDAAAEEQQQLRRQRTDADTARKRHNEEAAWLEYWATEQRLAAVIGELDQVDATLKATRIDAAAWPLTEAVLGRQTADALVQQLGAALRARNDETAPLLAERDRYAAALRAAHMRAAAHHEGEHHRAKQQGDDEKNAAERHETVAKEAQRIATTAHLQIERAQEQLDEAAQTRASAVAAGLLEHDDSAVSARDVETAAAHEKRELAETCDGEAVEAVQEAETALTDRTRAERDVGDAERRHNEASRGLEQYRAERAALVAMPALAELTDGNDDDLHAGADVLKAALRERISAIETEQREIDGQLDRARRDLQALADRKLLAPRPDVARALDALDAEGIQALSGYAYLDDAAPAAGRDKLVARHPHIADGIVLTDPEGAVADALETLKRAGVAPTFPVAVAPAHELLASGADPGWRLWGGDEALYDRTAAESRRLTLEQAALRLQARTEELVHTAEQGRQGATALDALVRAWPLARLESLRVDRHTAATDLDAAQARVAEASAALQAAKAAERAARAAAKAARASADEHLRRAEALSAAASAEHAAIGAGERIDHHREQRTTALADAERQSTAATNCRERRDSALTDAAEHASAVAQARSAAAEVVHVDREPEPELVGQPVTVLTERLALAQRQLDAEIGDDALARELEEARRESRRHDDRLRSSAAEIARRAEELSREPAAASPEGRAHQAQLAVEAVDRNTRRKSELDSQSGGLRSQLARVGRERTQPAELPASIERADELREQALATAGRQRALGESLAARIDELGRIERESERDAAVFRSLVDPLLEALPQQEPYGHGAQAATAARDADRAKRDRLVAEQHRRQQTVESARRAVEQQLRDTAAGAAQDLVDKLNRSDNELLASHAETLSEELASQVALIDERLVGLENDRQLIVSFLEPRVSDAIARLRALQRKSRLPSTLGAWADREFLTIRFEPPGDSARRLALVDRALDELLQSQNAPDGFKLLLHAVLTVLGRVRVSLLKPEPGLPSAQPIPVSGLSDLSGGERATIAILLYCALTNLRRETVAHSDRLAAVSALLLDNPFGKASSGFLVDQQMQMATALGMQLIYATAIEDANALDRFPVLVRLRNRQDLTRSMRYVRHDGQPAALAVEEGPPTIEAARLVRRENNEQHAQL